MRCSRALEARAAADDRRPSLVRLLAVAATAARGARHVVVSRSQVARVLGTCGLAWSRVQWHDVVNRVSAFVAADVAHVRGGEDATVALLSLAPRQSPGAHSPSRSCRASCVFRTLTVAHTCPQYPHTGSLRRSSGWVVNAYSPAAPLAAAGSVWGRRSLCRRQQWLQNSSSVPQTSARCQAELPV